MRRVLATLALLAAGLALAPRSAPQIERRQRAVRRGLAFIYRTARAPANFEIHGSDYLWCFYSIAATTPDPELRWLAWRMGQERALEYRRAGYELREGANADTVYSLLSGDFHASLLAFPDPALRERLRRAAARFPVDEFLRFDPRKEPPPADVPQACETCGTRGRRGARRCPRCGRELTMTSPWDLWQDALIATYLADRARVSLGASYQQVIRWLPYMRGYRGREGGANPDFDSMLYSATHVVYTLNDYSLRRLSPEWLREEFEFLSASLAPVITEDDPETVGEILDCLKAFGLGDDDPRIRQGVEFLLARQNPDGSWGEVDARDIYFRYHPTWTAVDGLRDYAWQGTRTRFRGEERTRWENQR